MNINNLYYIKLFNIKQNNKKTLYSFYLREILMLILGITINKQFLIFYMIIKILIVI